VFSPKRKPLKKMAMMDTCNSYAGVSFIGPFFFNFINLYIKITAKKGTNPQRGHKILYQNNLAEVVQDLMGF